MRQEGARKETETEGKGGHIRQLTDLREISKPNEHGFGSGKNQIKKKTYTFQRDLKMSGRRNEKKKTQLIKQKRE